MEPEEPADVLTTVLKKLRGVDWAREKERLREELKPYLVQDLLDGQYEVFGVAADATAKEHLELEAGRVEIRVHSSEPPDRAVLVRDSRGKWKIQSYMGQCMGCLGTGTILENTCRSCNGTGWGLHPPQDL